MSKRWYAVQAYSGYEKIVQKNLLERIERSSLKEMFGDVLVPVEEVVEMKSGQKTLSERRLYPGYVLVQMDMNDDSWHLVRSTPKVTAFIGLPHRSQHLLKIKKSTPFCSAWMTVR